MRFVPAGSEKGYVEGGEQKYRKEMHDIGLQETADLSAIPGDGWQHLSTASSLMKLFLAMGERDSFFLPLTSNAIKQVARAKNCMDGVSELDPGQEAASSGASCCRPWEEPLCDLGAEK